MFFWYMEGGIRIEKQDKNLKKSKTEIKRPVVSLLNPEPSPFLERRILAIQKTTKARFLRLQKISWLRRLNEKLRLQFKWYYNLRVDPLYQYDNVDDEMAAIQHSTKTLFKFAQPTHEKLRQKYAWYYRWHVRPHSSKIHFGVLSLYTATVIFGIFFSVFGGLHPTTRAATLSNCTWTNAVGTNYWNNAGNWSCGNVPTNANNVIFDGAVSSAPVNIDTAATAASFTVKGTNLPTTGDVAYTGTITANQNLTLDTTNVGTGSFYLGAGTYVANATTITVPGNWTTGAGFGTFTYGTSTVNMTGTSTITNSVGFYNLQIAAATKTTTLSSSTTNVYNVATLGTGAVSGGGVYLALNASIANPLVNNGVSSMTTVVLLFKGGGNINIPGGNYNGFQLGNATGNNVTYTATGNITLVNGLSITNVYVNYSTTFNTGGFTFTTGTAITLGNSGSPSAYGIAIFQPTGSGAVTVGTNTTIYAGTDASHHNAIDLSTYSGTMSVAGNWTNADTLTAGTTSTVSFTGAGTQTLATGGAGTGKAFFNVIHSGTGTLLPSAALDVNGDFSQTAGSFNNGSSVAQSFAGNFSLSAGTTWTMGGNWATFDGTTNYSDANATSQNIGSVKINGTSTTIVSGTMKVATLDVLGGNLVQTAGNINTTGAVSVAASQNWTNNGTGDVTLGGNVTNAGTVTFNGDEAGGQDSISILSTAASARTWTNTGAGSLSFTDVNVSYQTGAAPITAISSNDGGNNTNWIFATNKVISGSLYDGIGSTNKITDAKHIKVTVNGTAEAATVDTSGGDYTLTLANNLAADDKVVVFVSGETEKASAITKTSVAASGINIDLFQNYTVIRHEGTVTSIGYADLAVADTEGDVLFAVDGSNIATFTYGTYILNNKTYAPGANAIFQGNFANYGTFTAGTFTTTFDGTSTVLGPLATTFNNLTINSTKTLTGHATNMNIAANFLNQGSFTHNSGTVTFTGNASANQLVTTNAQSFNNFVVNNNQATYKSVTFSNTLDIDGVLTLTLGTLNLSTNNPAVNLSNNVAIASGATWTKGTSAVTFNGTSSFVDANATKQNIGTTVINGTSCTLASSMTVDTMTVTSGTLDLGNANYTLKLANAGAVADVLSVAGTLTTGTNSTVQYSATNSGGNVNVLTIPYDNLQFTPISGSESYNLTGSLIDANAMAGNVTIDANATVNTYVGTTSYDFTAVNMTLNASGALYAGTADTVGTSTFNISGTWDTFNNAFTRGMSTINLTGTGNLRCWGSIPLYNVNAAAATKTTTTVGAVTIQGVLTLGTGTLAGVQVSLSTIGSSPATPLITSGATITAPIGYVSLRNINITSTTYSSLLIDLNGSYTATLLGNITTTSLTIAGPLANYLTTVNTNNYNITATSLTLGTSGLTNYWGILNMGSGTLNVSGNVLIYPSTGASHNTLNLGSGTANIGGNWTNSDTFTYGTSTVNFNGTGVSNVTGANTFYNLTAPPGKNIIFPAGVTQTIAASGSLNLNGSTADMVHLRSSVPGTQWNISVPANQNVSYVDVKDSAQTNGTYTITDTNGNDGGNNNIYWVFSGTGNRFWVASADGNWNSAANWSASSGGAANASIPTSGNTAVFDQAGGNGSYTCTINTVVTVDNISVATYTNTITVNALTTTNTDINMTSGTINAATAGTVTINGDLLLSGTAAFTAPNGNLNLAGNFSNSGTFTPGTGNTIFTSTGTGRTITSGTAHFYNLIFNGTGGSWTMADNSTTDNNFTITAGTVIAGATTLNVGGSWMWVSPGTFTYGTSTVNMTGSGTISPSGSYFYNLTAAAVGKTTTIGTGSYTGVTVKNIITLGSGILNGTNGVINMDKSSITPLVFSDPANPPTISVQFQYVGQNQTITAATYSTLVIVNNWGVTTTHTLAGDITTAGLTIGTGAMGFSTVDTSNHNITASSLKLGETGQTDRNAKLNMGSGSLTVSGAVTIFAQSGANHNTLDLGSGTHYFGGTYANSDTLTAGTSTVNFNGAGTQTLNSGGVGAGKLFNNLTHSGAGTLQLLTNAYEVDGTFSQTAGTFNANARAQTYKGDFSLTGGTYTKGSTVTFSGTTNYSDTNAVSQNIGAVTINGTSTTVTSGTMLVDTIALTGGSLIQTTGSITTTGAITTSGGTFWTNNGNGKVTLGGNVTNAGTLSFDGDEATYGADPIAIVSTTTSNRTWTLSGAGSFSFTDVSVSYQTGAAPITATSSNDGGNNVNWIFATTNVISGYLFDGIGGSLITAVKTIAFSVNGAAVGGNTTTTDGSGNYTFTLGSNLAANDILSVFVSGDAVKASAITKTSVAASGITVDLFQNYTVLRTEGTIVSLTNADLDTADNVADADLLETVTASVPTFTQGIYILNNKVYAPGNNIVVQGSFANYGAFTPSTYTVTFDGTGTVLGTSITSFTNVTINNTMTMTGHATNMNVSGNFLNNGTFTHNSGTITFNGAAAQLFTTGAQTYNNIVLNNTGTAGANERITVSGNLDINGNLTITDGALYLVTNNPTVNVAGNVAIAATGIVTKGSGAWTFDGTTATTYSDLAATTSNLGAVTLNKTDTVTPTMNNLLTVTSNMTTDNLTIDGTSGQEDTLSIASAKTLTTVVWSTTTIQSGATISGAGTLKLNDNSGPNLSTTGTLNSQVQFAISSGNINIPARTYGGNVTILNGGSSNYIATLGTGAGQTLNFSSNFTATASSTGSLTVQADTNDPTVNITGDFAMTKSSTGLVKVGAGSGTWTFSGNFANSGGGVFGTTGVEGCGSTGTAGTVIFNGSSKTITGGAQCPETSFYDVQISGNTTNTTVNNLNVGHSFTVDSDITLTNSGDWKVLAGATTTINGTINGASTIYFVGTAAQNISTSGTLTANVDISGASSSNTNVTARTYGGNVTFTESDTNTRTVTLGTAISQTMNILGNVNIRSLGSGYITLTAITYNPTINITGNLTTTKTTTGPVNVYLGSSAWNVGGNVDLTGATVTPGASTLTMNNANGLVTQTLDNNDQTLNNLTHSGAGTLQLINHALTLNGTLTNSAGFFNANNLDLTIAGSLNNTATITNATTNTTTFNGVSSGNIIRTNGSSLNNVTVNSVTGTAGFWKLDEGTGTNAADSSGNGKNGTLTGPTHLPTWTATTPNAAYYNGDPYAVNFDGIDDYVVNSLSGVSLTNLSISLWVRPTGAQSTKGIFQWSNALTSSMPFILLQRATSTTASWYVNGTYRATITVNDDTWYHMVVTYDGTNWNFYTNASAPATYAGGMLQQANATGIYMGNGWNGYYRGIIDDFRVYNRTLSATEITTLYGGTNGTYQLQDTLTAAGDMTITAGTLDANGNNMTVGGNWSNADTFTPGANTVTFNKATDTQTLDSGGTAAGKLFNNVTHSGAGTLQLITNTLNIDGNFVNSAGTLDTNSIDVTLAGNYDSTGGTVTTGSSTVTFDGAVAQSITSAGQPFYNLTLNNSGTGAGDDITPADALDVNGTFTITDGEFSTGSNNINIAGDMTIASAGTFTKGSTTLTFDGALTPSVLTDSSSSAPQNIGFVTVNKNNIITPSANLLTLATATLIDSLNIATDNILNAAGFGIADSGNWSNSGTATIGAGTVTLTGAGGTTQAISGDTTFDNLTATATSARTLQFAATSTTTVTGTWTITGAGSNLITLTTSSAPTQWIINSAASTISYADINYSNNTGAAICATFSTSTNDNNTLWGIIAGGGSCNAAPNSASALGQTKTDDSVIATGGWTNEQSVKFTATADDLDASDTLYLCIEKDIVGTSFSNTEDSCGSGVAYSGTPVDLFDTIGSITDANVYHWQARIKDAAGAYSSWLSYPLAPSDNLESATDFGIDATAPNDGTIFDGTSAGVDADYNDGSLTSLSANWSGIDSTVSGLQKYEYAIGTTAGGTDVKTWTNNTTDTTVTASGLILQTGQPYYFSVRTTDNAGNLAAAINSNGQAVAPTLTFGYLGGDIVTFEKLGLNNSYTDDTKETILQTSTNAFGGYIIKARAIDALRSPSNIDLSIAHYLGLNSTPTTWSGTGFGYSTNDDNLSSGTADRFTNGGPKYAGWVEDAPGDIIADHTSNIVGAPITNEQFTIKYRVTADALTAAGFYRTMIVYTAIPQY